MNNIKKYRERKGLKQKELAIQTGLSRAAISLFESGKSTPSLNSAYKISRVLDTTIDELFFVI